MDDKEITHPDGEGKAQTWRIGTEAPDHDNAKLAMSLTICGNKYDSGTQVELTLGDLTALLSISDERNAKDGPAAIYAKLSEGREDANVDTICAYAYEVDGKLTYDAICGCVAASGLEAFVYTTHNHMRTSQDVGVATYCKWLAQKGVAWETAGDANIAAFCAGHPKYNHLTNVSRVDGNTIKRVRAYGKLVEVISISHDPEHKTRVIVPISSTISLKVQARGKQAHKIVYSELGERLLGSAFSTESCNPSRLQYLPSHRPGKPFAFRHIRGELLNLTEAFEKAVKLPAPAARSYSRTAEAGEVSYYLQFIPPDIEYPCWFKALGAIHHETGGGDEGFELAREWSEGDPRFDYLQLETIWDKLDPDHAKPATLGYLIKLAREFQPNLRQFKNLGGRFALLDKMERAFNEQ
ncbi:MAG: PriCT-2 domain-containing protein [Hyphomicrobiaceae bacterium]|nr:PriCT-2 domain-containing protein [Hyphomicrobiaceae bacterium]